jgi:hypothetical protein
MGPVEKRLQQLIMAQSAPNRTVLPLLRKFQRMHGLPPQGMDEATLQRLQWAFEYPTPHHRLFPKGDKDNGT